MMIVSQYYQPAVDLLAIISSLAAEQCHGVVWPGYDIRAIQAYGVGLVKP